MTATRSTTLKRLALALLALAPPAHAAGTVKWRHLDAQQPRAIETFNFAVGADDSLWTHSISGVHRTDATGVTSAPLAAEPNPHRPGISGLSLLADGGAIVFEDGLLASGQDCHLSRLARSVQALWRTSLPGRCHGFAALPTGGVWVMNEDKIVKLGADGAVAHTTLASSGDTTGMLLTATADGGVVLAREERAEPAERVKRYAADGSLLWAWPHPNLTITKLIAAPDGSVTVVGHMPSQGLLAGDIHLTRLRADGTVLWSYTTQGRSEYAEDALAVADGSLRVLIQGISQSSGAAWGLYRINADGTFGWRQDACAGSDYFPYIAAQPGGELALVCSSRSQARLERIDASGTTARVLPLANFIGTAPLAMRPSGLVQVGSFFAADLRSGHLVDTPATSPSSPETRTSSATHLDSDGSSYLLTRSRQGYGGPVNLSKVDANGSPVWNQQLADSDLQLSIAGKRACVAGQRSTATDVLIDITCLSTETGAVLWRQSQPRLPLPPPSGGFGAPPHYELRIAVLQEGSVVVLQSGPDAHEYQRLDRNGAEVARTGQPGRMASASVNPAGPTTLGLVQPDTTWKLVQYDLQGTPRQLATGTNAPLKITDGSTAADGSVLALAEPTPGERALWSIASNGNVIWKKARSPDLARARLLRTDTALYLIEDQAAIASLNTTTRLTRIAPLDGQTLWQTDAVEPAALGPEGQFAVTPDGQAAVLVQRSQEQLRLQRFWTRDGSLAGTDRIPCDALCYAPQAIAFDRADSVRVALDVFDSIKGQTAAVTAVNVLPDARPRIRRNPPELRGVR